MRTRLMLRELPAPRPRLGCCSVLGVSLGSCVCAGSRRAAPRIRRRCATTRPEGTCWHASVRRLAEPPAESNRRPHPYHGITGEPLFGGLDPQSLAVELAVFCWVAATLSSILAGVRSARSAAPRWRVENCGQPQPQTEATSDVSARRHAEACRRATPAQRRKEEGTERTERDAMWRCRQDQSPCPPAAASP